MCGELITTAYGWNPLAKPTPTYRHFTHCPNGTLAIIEVGGPVVVTPKPEPSPASVTASPAPGGKYANDPLRAAILDVVRDEGTVNADSVIEILDKQFSTVYAQLLTAMVDKRLKDMTSRTTVEILDRRTDPPTLTDVGPQHREFSTLLDVLQARQPHNGARLNVWLAGPTGSGKTTSAKKAAQALGMRFGFCGAMDTEYKLLGFVNAQGQIVDTEFKRFYTEGGVYLLDEVDSWLPSALLALNAALANGECAFPEGTLPRHPEFLAIAGANTWGMGGTTDYVGRTKLDAAFLARFSLKIYWDYDEDLELTLVPAEYHAWAKRVQTLRANARRQGLQVIIHPRYIYEGAAMLAMGWDMARLENYTIRPVMKPEQWEMICR
jgi:hypothetical protein